MLNCHVGGMLACCFVYNECGEIMHDASLRCKHGTILYERDMPQKMPHEMVIGKQLGKTRRRES